MRTCCREGGGVMVMGIVQEMMGGWMVILPPRKWNLLHLLEWTLQCQLLPLALYSYFWQGPCWITWLRKPTCTACTVGMSSNKKNALNWQGCSLGDIAHCLGLSMLMGIIRLPNLRLYWSTETLYKFPQFSSVMTSARYLELSRFSSCIQ